MATQVTTIVSGCNWKESGPIAKLYYWVEIIACRVKLEPTFRVVCSLHPLARRQRGTWIG